MQHSRRVFLGAAPRGQGNPLRPPWAIPETEFLSLCTRCQDCIDVCPTGLLKRGLGTYPEAGFVQQELTAHCSFCTECVRACAPGALRLGEEGRNPWAVRAVIGEACLAERGVVCYSCRESCEVLAIGFGYSAQGIPIPQLDSGRCTGCGECLADCPTQAIRMSLPDTNYPFPRGVA